MRFDFLLRRARQSKHLALGLSLCLPLLSAPAHAAKLARLLRVDPSASLVDGVPVLTTLFEVAEPQSWGELMAPCAGLKGNAADACLADQVERPFALVKPVDLPSKDLHLTVRLGESEVEAKLMNVRSLGESQGEPQMGTGWLLALDLASQGGDGLDALKAVTKRFLEQMGPADQLYLALLGDRQILSETGWLARGQVPAALKVLEDSKLSSSTGRTRPLLQLLRQVTGDALSTLPTPGEGSSPPLLQSLVVLSSGYGGGDPSTTGPGASQFRQYLSEGRFAEQNTQLPKLPLPVISILTPPRGVDEYRALSRDFMENLANPEMGGLFTIIQKGQENHASRIVDAVRARFSRFSLARFHLSCLAAKSTQSFSLLFSESTHIAGDNSFRDVPLGFDPARWPLQLDRETTRQKIEAEGGLAPGGKLRIYGDFCWGGASDRPEVYFLPPGENLPKELGTDPEASLKQLEKRLMSLGMRASCTSAGPSFAEFQVPETEQLLHGDGQRQVARFVVFDRKMRQTSGLTESQVLQVKGQRAPVSLLSWILAGLGGVLVLTLSSIVVVGASRRRDSARTSRPSPRIDGSPYATPAPVSRSPRSTSPAMARALLEGTSVKFTVVSGTDLRVGRDGARCAAVLPNPQVSGFHATFRIDGSRVFVRDEGSTSGTRIDGRLLEAGRWTSLEDGAEVSIGPEKLRLRCRGDG